MDNFDLKKYLVENKVTTNSRMLEVEMGMVPADVTGQDSYDGALPAGTKEDIKDLTDKIKAKILNSPLLDKIANKAISTMSQDQKTTILQMFGADQGRVPSFEDVYAVITQKAPKGNLNEVVDEESVGGIALRLVRSVAGLNLIFAGALIPAVVGMVLGIGPRTATMGAIWIATVVASLIIHKICSNLLGMDGNDSMT
jgi:hypothetical protein